MRAAIGNSASPANPSPGRAAISIALAVALVCAPAWCETLEPASPTTGTIAAAAVAPQAAPQDEPAAPGGALRSPESFGARHRFLRGVGEILAVNTIQNLYGRYLMPEESRDGFKVTWDSIEENFRAGMNWDDNTFSTNNFRHPYQGSMYYVAGRANHYDFWHSTFFAFGGSWLWEYTGESHNPSFNDWINTAVGGMILGEVTYRLSSLVLDNTATGSGRTARELAGFLLCPVRGANRLFTGAAFTVHANPVERLPTDWAGEFRFGLRTIGTDRLFDGSGSKLFLAVDGTYGDMFGEIDSPYDHFNVGMQLNFNNSPRGIGRLEARGVLFGGDVSRSDKTQHVLAAYQHFDYVDNEAYTYGGMSFGPSFLSKFALGDATMRTALHISGVVLGATRSNYFNISGREYDYGPGIAVQIAAKIGHGSGGNLTLAHDSFYTHSVNGGAVNSWNTISRAKFGIPIRDQMKVGLEYVSMSSIQDYPDRPRVDARSPELRVSLTWDMQ